MMHTRLEELSTQMDQFTQSVRSGLDGFLSEWAKLPPEVEKVAADLTGLRQASMLGMARAANELFARSTRSGTQYGCDTK